MLIYYLLLFIIWFGQYYLFDKYIFSIKSSNVLSHEEKKNNSVFCMIILLFILLFSLKAVSVGRDTMVYKEEFDRAYFLYHNPYMIYEKGFYAFNYYLHDVLKINWQVYLFICSIILIIPLFLYIKKHSCNQFFSAFLFVTIGNFTMYMSGLRQSIACSLCLLALLIIESNRFNSVIRYIIASLIVFMAYSFHNTAVIFYLVFVLYIWKPKLSKNSAIIILTFASASLVYGRLLLIFIQKYLPMKYQDKDIIQTYSLNPLLPIIAIGIYLFCVVLLPVNEEKKFDEYTSILLIFSALRVFFTCISYSNGLVGRILYYFDIATLLLLPTSFKGLKYRDKIIAGFVIGVLCVMYFQIASSGGMLKIDQYRFFWDE